MMTRVQLEMLIAVVVAVVLGLLVAWGGNHYMKLREKAAQSDLRGEVIKNTDGIIKDGAESDERRQRVDIAITDGRVRYQEDYEREKANDPAFADRADSVVDQRVREQARARRLARERSARNDAGSAKGTAGAKPVER